SRLQALGIAVGTITHLFDVALGLALPAFGVGALGLCGAQLRVQLLHALLERRGLGGFRQVPDPGGRSLKCGVQFLQVGQSGLGCGFGFRLRRLRGSEMRVAGPRACVVKAPLLPWSACSWVGPPEAAVLTRGGRAVTRRPTRWSTRASSR